MDLDTSLEELSWIPRPRILALRRLALETVGDLRSGTIHAGTKIGENSVGFRVKKLSARFVCAARWQRPD